jgi:ABC-type polysaccharide transport system permease subunit
MGGSGQAVAASSVSAPTQRPIRRSRRITRDRVFSLALITPSIIAIAVFVYGMIGWTTFVSFTKWNTFSPNYALNGFANYVYIFNNARFQLDLRNNIVFTIFFVSVSLAIGLLLASLLDRHIRARASSAASSVPDGDQFHRHRRRLEVAAHAVGRLQLAVRP